MVVNVPVLEYLQSCACGRMHLLRPIQHETPQIPMKNCPKHTDLPSTSVGYIRVSTEKQNDGDHALEKQAEKIRRFCAERGMKLVGIYEDIGSAADAHSLSRRSGLQNALALARDEGACLLVPEPTRLSRNVEAATQWVKSVDVPVVSVREGSVLSQTALLDAVRAGESAVRKVRIATSKALGRIRSAGQPLGSPADKSLANKASALARAQRSDAIVDVIALILLEDLAYRDLTHRALADLLNRRKVLTGWLRPWTPAGVKRSRGLAERRIAEWQELEDDVDSVDLPAKPLLCSPSASASVSKDDEKMRNLPTWAKF